MAGNRFVNVASLTLVRPVPLYSSQMEMSNSRFPEVRFRFGARGGRGDRHLRNEGQRACGEPLWVSIVPEGAERAGRLPGGVIHCENPDLRAFAFWKNCATITVF